MGGAKIPEGVPISLGNLAWGCQIPDLFRLPESTLVHFDVVLYVLIKGILQKNNKCSCILTNWLRFELFGVMSIVCGNSCAKDPSVSFHHFPADHTNVASYMHSTWIICK